MTKKTVLQLNAMFADTPAANITATEMRDLIDTLAPVYLATSVSGAYSLNYASCNIAELTLTADLTNFQIINGVTGHTVRVTFIPNGFEMTGSTGIHWEGAAYPLMSETAGLRDSYQFYYNGTLWIEISESAGIGAP